MIYKDDTVEYIHYSNHYCIVPSWANCVRLIIIGGDGVGEYSADGDDRNILIQNVY